MTYIMYTKYTLAYTTVLFFFYSANACIQIQYTFLVGPFPFDVLHQRAPSGRRDAANAEIRPRDTPSSASPLMEAERSRRAPRSVHRSVRRHQHHSSSQSHTVAH